MCCAHKFHKPHFFFFCQLGNFSFVIKAALTVLSNRDELSPAGPILYFVCLSRVTISFFFLSQSDSLAA